MSDKLYRVAIVGAATLKGKELKDTLNGSDFPAIDIRLLDDDESLGQLDAVGDEATFVQAVTAESFRDVKVAFFASDHVFTRKHWTLARDGGVLVVDLSYALEGEPGAALRSPWTAKEVPEEELGAQVIVPAHPAAVVLALLLERARAVAEMRSVVATVYEPASEQGRRGMDELHQQTVNLLSFQPMPTGIYDAQLAFNMLARYGANAPAALEATERRILEHFQKIASPRLPIPSLMLVQAPVFHGHVFSVYIELEKKAAVGDFAQALAGAHVAVARAGESPSNVGAAGQDEIMIGLRRDLQKDNAFWLWAAADNLRVQSVTAVEAAQQAIELRRAR
ncbi:MAG TPA: Asd/ArgC dimerization domain-containing protein [Terriglobales bacterium]|jgi:aspartate-semialdehyde dehydrogenase|nr:Asd/ArgC dimerization domain-containing protein [Terriglobales bacterium]